MKCHCGKPARPSHAEQEMPGHATRCCDCFDAYIADEPKFCAECAECAAADE